jgi:uncharacterized repeat protein (TIGR01451 family)
MDGVPPYRPPNYNEADVSDKPRWVRGLPLLDQAKQDFVDFKYRRRLESLQSVDRAVEAIVNALSDTGRLDNTVLIFFSDNGYSLGAHRWIPKDCVYEECSRAPLLVRAPGVTPHTEDALIQSTDITASIREWAGVTDPVKLDGKSFVSLLSNPGAPFRDSILLEEPGIGPNYNYQAVRTQQYLYAEYANSLQTTPADTELYDLNADPYELQNIVSDPGHADVVAQLKDLLNTYKNSADLGVRVTAVNPNPAPAGGQVTYTITVANQGPSSAHSADVRTIFPPNLTFVSCTQTFAKISAVCRHGSATIDMSFFRIRSGESDTFTIAAKIADGVPSGTKLWSTTKIIPFDTTDGNSANDSTTAVVTVR